MITLIFIQEPKPQHEVSKDFYDFQNRNGLTYEDEIRVEAKNGDTIYDRTTVNNYLKTLPE